MKIVLTGGACSGKTTLLEELKRRGYCCSGETAREVLERYKDRQVCCLDIAKIQTEILERQLEREQGIPDSEVCFFDRSVVDVVTYSRGICEKSLRAAITASEKTNYHRVFFLQRLPFENDGLRVESDDMEAGEKHERLMEDYQTFGYRPITVPVLPIGERVKYILDRIN